MAWSDGATTGQGSTTATRAARARCLAAAAHRCHIRHPGCTTTATEAHHPDSLADTARTRAQAIDADRLVATCRHCHTIETQRQATRARNRWKRQPEPHPALTTPR